MTWDLFVQLVGHLAWPVAVVVLLAAFRRQVAERIGQAREVEMLGAKFTLDPAAVKKVAEDVAGGKVSPEEGAVRLEASAVGAEEARVLRALVDERDGRLMYGYRPHYDTVFARLMKRGWVDTMDGKYRLTGPGKQAAREYLSQVLKREW